MDDFCMCCMEHSLGQNGICSRCGAAEASLNPSPHHLRPRTLLRDRYMIGKVLGEGGFGITYVGWDTLFYTKVAIKEYFPNGFVMRDSTR